jgi:uncharacterized protein with PIN domain
LRKEKLMGIILDILKEFPLSAVLRERLIEVEKRLAICGAALEKCMSDKEILHLQIENIKKSEAILGDPCPYCKQRKGELLRLTPHPLFGEVGVKIGVYKCANCGKEYEKEHHP